MRTTNEMEKQAIKIAKKIGKATSTELDHERSLLADLIFKEIMDISMLDSSAEETKEKKVFLSKIKSWVMTGIISESFIRTAEMNLHDTYIRYLNESMEVVI